MDEKELLLQIGKLIEHQVEQVGQKMESMEQRINLQIENEVTQKIELIFDKLDSIDQKLSTMPTVEDMAISDGRIEVLEAIVKKLSRDIATLKKAQ